ncbi:MAG: hypothetical protein HC883_03625 [Bdellovibrionaceae bacterium]|nr:hypothetical protein [Pseudobdellovibrionaceae bacterium]
MKSWMNPKWRVLTFLILINLAWILGSWAWTERETWLWITPIALSINLLLLTYDQVLTFSRLESRPLVGQDPWGILKTVHRLSQRFELPEPQVFLIPHPSAQVFSYARARAQTRLFLTEGAVQLLRPRELEAILTFQLMSMDRSIPLLNYWVGALLDLFYRVGSAFERAFALIFGWAPQLATWFIAPVSWVLHFLLLSSHDFQKLDRRTAAMIDNPEDLARALWKMESYAQTQPWRESWVFAHMCIVSPLDWKNIQNILRVQPPVKRRIKDLLGRYPL